MADDATIRFVLEEAGSSPSGVDVRTTPGGGGTADSLAALRKRYPGVNEGFLAQLNEKHQSLLASEKEKSKTGGPISPKTPKGEGAPEEGLPGKAIILPKTKKKEEEKRDDSPGAFGRWLSRNLRQAGPAVGAAVGASTGSGLLGAAAGSATSGLGTLAASNPAAAAAVAVVGATVGLFSKLNDELTDAARGIEQFSGNVAQAFAEQDVALIHARLRRARETGDVLATFTRQKTQALVIWEDIKTDLIKATAPIATQLLKALVTFLELAKPAFELLAEAGENGREVAAKALDGALGIASLLLTEKQKTKILDAILGELKEEKPVVGNNRVFDIVNPDMFRAPVDAGFGNNANLGIF